jgi:hypothetical protein
MKKYLKFIPHVVFAAGLILLGAIGKLTGAAPAVAMFEQINMFGLGEQFGRIAVGLGQLFAGIGVFFVVTRKSAAVIGVAIMAGAVFYSIDLFGTSPVAPLIVMVLGIYILLAGGCKGCAKGKCSNGTCKA